MKFHPVFKNGLMVFIFVYLFFALFPLVGFAQSRDIDNNCCVCRTFQTKYSRIQSSVRCDLYLSREECENKSKSSVNIYSPVTKCALESCSIRECSSIPILRTEPEQTPLPALIFKPNVPIPGFANTTIDSGLLARYIKALYKFFVGIAGILAVIMIAFGGLQWLFSGGSSEKISKAKETIIGAVMGLILALGSYLILNTINPNLVSFKPLVLDQLGELRIGIFCGLDEQVVDNNGKTTLGKYLKCGQKAQSKDTNQSCIGSGCLRENQGEVCYFNQGMQESACLKCNEVDDDVMRSYNIPENNAGCAVLTPQIQSGSYIQICAYSQERDLDLNDDTCFLIDVDCSQIDDCHKYNGVFARAQYVANLASIESEHLERVCTKDLNNNPSASGICPNRGVWLPRGQTCYMYNDSDCREKAADDGGGGPSSWLFNSDIEAQMIDAGTDLIQLLACLRNNLLSGVGRISSISDSNYTNSSAVGRERGGPAACDPSEGACPASPRCAHACNSCHYGGGDHNGSSHAVDIDDWEEGNNRRYIEIAMDACDDMIGFRKDEGDHIHISTKACQNN